MRHQHFLVTAQEKGGQRRLNAAIVRAMSPREARKRAKRVVQKGFRIMSIAPVSREAAERL